jgi:diguanylate cyclase (GGDEF)-like protein/PAS domain S-box-containing protein
VALQSSWLTRIVQRGFLPTDDANQRLKKVALTLVPLIIGPAAFLWGSIYFLLGHPVSGSIPMSYSIISAVSLLYFFATKRTVFLQYSQLTLVLLLPFLLMWSLGGFSAGSMVMIWAIFAPVAAVMFLEKRIALVWFLMYFVLIVASVLLDDHLKVIISPLPDFARSAFYLLNLGCGSAGLYLLVSYALNEEKRAAEADLRIAATAFDSQAGVVVTDAKGVILRVNHAFTELTGYTPEETAGQTTRLLKSNRHDDDFYRVLWKTIQATGRWQGEIWDRHKRGDLFPAWLTITAVRNDERVVTHYVATYFDITERKQQEEEIRKLLTENEAILDNAMIGIVYIKHRRVVTCNRRLEEIFQYDPGELIGESSERFYESRDVFEHIGKVAYQVVAEGKSFTAELPLRHKDGSVFWGALSGRAIDPMHPQEGSIWIYSDITERKEAEDKINELAFYDQLTGLPNRTLLLDRLKQAMNASSRSGSFGALLLVDLDHFKTVNDTHGHDMGDLLLKEVAQRLTTCVRAGDTAARLGGDEFVVMLVNLSTSGSDAANQTETVGKKILAILNQPYQLRNIPWHSTPSIGVILFNGEQNEIESLLKQADLAMYKSKEAGRNALHFFDPEMEVVVMKRALLEKDLREAIAGNQFLLHYQAQAAGGKLTGAEVLVRWQHPQRGMVSPVEFIPLAEETGLILPLGHWVLETACNQLAEWATQHDMAHLTVAVNVSARQFRHPDFVDQVLAVLKESGAEPQRLKLELTESLLVANVEEVIAKMYALKGQGVGFSLDDFGTGYSSLAYLKRLPLDQLKIDQSFVRDVLTDPNDAAIAKTIVALAQSLGLGVIAEGVEVEAQRDFLASFGCHAYQGYWFSRPLPVNDFERFARRTASYPTNTASGAGT